MKRTVMLAVFLAAAVAAMTAQSSVVVSAEDPVIVSGTMSQKSTSTVWVKVAGTNIFMLNSNVWDVFGSLQGELTSEPLVTIHQESGEILVHEWATFTGTWDGMDGTLTIRNVGGMVGPGLFHLDSTIAKGTGVFKGVYGWGYADVDINTNPPSASYYYELFWEDED